jgi:hypothetical protein
LVLATNTNTKHRAGEECSGIAAPKKSAYRAGLTNLCSEHPSFNPSFLIKKIVKKSGCENCGKIGEKYWWVEMLDAEMLDKIDDSPQSFKIPSLLDAKTPSRSYDFLNRSLPQSPLTFRGKTPSKRRELPDLPPHIPDEIENIERDISFVSSEFSEQESFWETTANFSLRMDEGSSHILPDALVDSFPQQQVVCKMPGHWISRKRDPKHFINHPGRSIHITHYQV